MIRRSGTKNDAIRSISQGIAPLAYVNDRKNEASFRPDPRKPNKLSGKLADVNRMAHLVA